MQQAAAAADQAAVSAADDVKAAVEAQLQASLEAALNAPREQIAEPLYWWDSPLAPGKILRVGEKGYLVTVFIVNPFPLPQDPNIRPVDFLTVWKLPYRIDYSTLNTSTGRPVPSLNATHYGNLVPGQAYYVDVFEFTAYEPGCIFETNICARILDCENGHPGYGHGYGKSPSPFAGFARSILNLDPELFLPTQYLEFDNPIRFMVYE
jgi:hypothetical protein